MLRRLLPVFLLVLLLFSAALPASAKRGKKPDTSAGTVLILYDTTGEYGWLGQIHARLLANLLGHFPVTYKACPVERYRRGDIDRSLATFYIGSTYESPLPSTFLTDVMGTSRPVCWFKYNIWQIAWTDGTFPTRFGFQFNYLDWSGYDTIHYNGESFTKYQDDPELGSVSVLDTSICTEVATATRSSAGGTPSMPYVVHGANLWYVADVPFTYISEEDRYVAFCDLLHDILGIDHPESKRALLRIEDVDPTSDPAALRKIADYLKRRKVPFAVSVIPVYTDPFGYYSDGVPVYKEMTSEPEFVDTLHYMVQRGGSIVLHGYTHQYDTTINCYTGVTGDDFEFYSVELAPDLQCIYTGPLPEDSPSYASNLIAQGRAALQACGLQEVAWETPHYAASATDYKVFGSQFPLTIQRALYFDLPIPPHGFKGTGDPTYFGGQFFPYVIERDIYGQKIAPENCGCIDPFGWWGYPVRFPDAVLRAAENNRAVRDGWASFYFHSFYKFSYLQDMVEGIQGMGYTFVPLSPNMH